MFYIFNAVTSPSTSTHLLGERWNLFMLEIYNNNNNHNNINNNKEVSFYYGKRFQNEIVILPPLFKPRYSIVSSGMVSWVRSCKNPDLCHLSHIYVYV